MTERNLTERNPGWTVVDGLITCTADDTVLDLLPMPAGSLFHLRCWKCQAVFVLPPVNAVKLSRELSVLSRLSGL